jgi:predicted transcriptional regulator
VVGSLQLNNAEDLIRLMPDSLPEKFTTADLAEKLGRPRSAAQQMAYCLRKTGVCVAVGKRGNNVECRAG